MARARSRLSRTAPIRGSGDVFAWRIFCPRCQEDRVLPEAADKLGLRRLMEDFDDWHWDWCLPTIPVKDRM